MLDTEAAYLAGIIDGEGTVTIGAFTRGGNLRYQPKVLVVNTSLLLVQHVHRVSGRGIAYQSKREASPTNPKWNPVHRYQVVARQAIDLLRDVRPYLLLKAEHADLLLGMPTRSKGRGGDDVGIVMEQARICARIRELNARGKTRNFVAVG